MFTIKVTIYNVSPQSNPEVLMSIENADLITISIGANDALAGLDAELIGALNKIKLSKEAITEQAGTILQSLEELQTQINSYDLDRINDADVREIVNKKLANVVENSQTILLNMNTFEETNEISEDEIFSAVENMLFELQGALLAIQSLDDQELVIDIVAMIETSENIGNRFTKIGNSIEIINENSVIVSQKVSTIMEAIGGVAQNLNEILSTITDLNPNTKIYVMGYYNALPYMDSEFVVPLLNILNDAIESSTSDDNITYVPTFNNFQENIFVYLDNPSNIHPNDTGYQALADAFMSYIGITFSGPEVIEEPEDPLEPPPPIEDIEDPEEDPEVGPEEENGDTEEDERGNESGDGIEEKENEEDEKTITVSLDKDKTLPKTATAYYNWLVVGSFLLTTGIVTFFARRKLFMNRQY